MAIWEVGSGKTYTVIQSALDALFASVGTDAFTETQTIRVYNGTYGEAVAPNTGLNPTATYRLVIEKAAGNSPVIAGSDTLLQGIYIASIDYVTVDGFEVKEFVYNGIVPITNATYNIVKNCISHDNGDCGIFFYGGCSNGLAENNTTYNNVSVGIQLNGSINCIAKSNYTYANAIGIAAAGTATDALLYNNLSRANNFGLQVASSTGAKIYNNDFVNNASNDIRIESGSAGFNLRNNAIYTAGLCYAILNDASLVGSTSDYNIFHQTAGSYFGYSESGYKNTITDWRTALSIDANSIVDDPDFVNASGTTADDFKITTDSPCKDAGADLSATLTTDYFGTVRPQNSIFDIGFHEFPYTAPVTPTTTTRIKVIKYWVNTTKNGRRRRR